MPQSGRGEGGGAGGTGDRKQNDFPKHKSNADRQQQGYKSTLSTAAFQDKQHNTAIKERKRGLFSFYEMGGQINVRKLYHKHFLEVFFFSV